MPTAASPITDQGSSNGTFVNGERIARDRADAAGGRRSDSARHKVVLKLVRLDPHDERFQRELFERTSGIR